MIYKFIRYFEAFKKIIKIIYDSKTYDRRFKGQWQFRYFNNDNSVNVRSFGFFKNYCTYSSFYFNEMLKKWILIENSQSISKWNVSDDILNIENVGKYKFEFIGDSLLLDDDFYISSEEMKEVLEYELLKYKIEN